MGRKAKNKVEYSDDGKTLIRCPNSYKGVFEIPLGVMIIGEKAFFRCELLTGVRIPNSVVQIMDSAFSSCLDLSFVEIEKGSNIITIGAGAFADCEKLNGFEIPERVTKINPCTFQNCTYLEEINIPNGVTSIESEAFYCCSNLKTITIPNTVKVIGQSAFCACASLKDVSIPNSVEEICTSAFDSCINLAKVSVGSESNLNHIRREAFRNCYRLVSINIPDNIQTIEDNAFLYCDSLKSLFIPAFTANIGTEIAAMCNMDFTFYCEFEQDPGWHPEWNHMGGRSSPKPKSSIASVMYHTPRWWYEKFVLPRSVQEGLIRTSSHDDDYDGEKMKEFISGTDKTLYLRSGWEWRGIGREEVTKEKAIEVIDAFSYFEIIEYDNAVLVNTYS